MLVSPMNPFRKIYTTKYINLIVELSAGTGTPVQHIRDVQQDGGTQDGHHQGQVWSDLQGPRILGKPS